MRFSKIVAFQVKTFQKKFSTIWTIMYHVLCKHNGVLILMDLALYKF